MATVVLDNGAYSAKIGYTTDTTPKVVPNCIIKAKTVRNRVFVGDQIDECKDLSGLFFMLPFQKGYLTNWDIQKQVWDHMFSKNSLNTNLEESGVIVTEAQFNFKSVQEIIDEVFMQEYNVPFLLRCTSSYLSYYSTFKDIPNMTCCLVVDSGYSFTHLIPYHKGKPIKEATKRISVGGKLLTNHLKEIISYRQLMVMDETHVVNQIKEDTCFVSQHFNNDMKTARLRGVSNSIACDYILPDYTHIKRGHVRETGVQLDSSQQIIRMCNERFSIPELLFHPSDIGISEMGIPQAILHVINLTPEELRPFFFLNIILTGGNCRFPGFKDRVHKEVRALAPDLFEVSLRCSEEPDMTAWRGGVRLGNSADLLNLIVTKDQYEEFGPNICHSTFLY